MKTKENKPKPTIRTVKHYDYHECADWVAAKLGVKCIDDMTGYFDRNADLEKKYEKVTEDKMPERQYTKSKKVSKAYSEWWKRKEAWRKKQPEIEYRNFWHWICNRFEVHNGCDITLSEEELDDCWESTPEWVKPVIRCFLDEFGKGKNKTVTMECSW